MRHLLGLLVLAVSLGASPIAPPAAAADPLATADGATTVTVSEHPLTPAAAPADEYFGRLKLSNLGIRNIIRAFRVEGNSPLALPIQRGRMEAVDSAIVDWSDKYPRDPWLSGVIFGFADVLSIKHDPETDAMAIDLLLRESQRNEGTRYERRALAAISAMHPVHLVDWSVAPIDPPDLADLVGSEQK
jgi:hypothetical protein